MAGGKEIRSKISSVQNTQKITKAMEMVAASKMRKTQERMAASRPYAETIREVIGHLALGNLEYKHPYLDERDIKRVGYLVVSTDRGLCGGLNINLFKRLLAEMKGWSEKGVEVDLALIGSKAASFFSSVGANVVAQVTGMGDNPSLSELIGPVKVMLQAFDEGRLDKLCVLAINSSIPCLRNHASFSCCLCLRQKMARWRKNPGITCMSQTLKHCWIPSCAAMWNLRFIRAS